MKPEPYNPYAASASGDAPPEESRLVVLPPGAYGPYRDNRLLSRWLVGLLLFGLLAHGARIAVNLVYFFADWFDDPEVSERIEAVFAKTWPTGLSCMIVFGVWIVRSGKNAWLFAGFMRAHRLPGATTSWKLLEDTPGWAVGWYFIPIASLWKPYVAMRDIVRASTLEAGLPGWLLPSWWTLWIISQITDRGTQKLQNIAAEWESVEQFVFWTSASGIEIAVHTVAILLVRGVTQLQSDTAATLAAADFSEPAPT